MVGFTGDHPMKPSRIASLVCATLVTAAAQAANVNLPGGTLVIPGTSSAGASFTYTGTLTQADTIAFSQTGNPCLQSGNTYCVNGAGVIVVAGTSPVGASTGFGSWTYGALLMQISGVGTVQVWPTNAANGLGSGSPPTGLTLPTTTLAALGFPAFSQANPTITFIVADTNFGDNSESFTLTQAAAPAAVAPVPTLAEWSLGALALLVGLGGAARARRR